MFLEKCGQFFFQRVRPLFFFGLAFSPLIAVSFYLFMQYTEIEDLEQRFASAAKKEKIASQRRGRKERFLERYSNPNPYYLDQKIESFSLLQAERERLEALLHHPAFPESSKTKERLFFLNENKLNFIEERIRASSWIKEVEEKQRQSVQMDESDLKKILSLIEDVPIDTISPPTDSPQLVIKDIRLKKQTTPLETEVWEVEMDLIKREFTKL